MFKGLFMKNLTSGSSVGHPWAGTKCLCGCTSHSVTCTVFDSSKVFPPKDKANPLKTVVEISSPGSKCCSHPPFPHRILFPEKESHKLLSFQTEGREYQNHSAFWQSKVSLYIVLHVTGRARLKCCCLNVKMQSRTIQTKRGFAGFSELGQISKPSEEPLQVKGERLPHTWQDAEE